jgi:hypothetical protein
MLVSEHKGELGAALTQLIAALERSAWMAFNPETVTSRGPAGFRRVEASGLQPEDDLGDRYLNPYPQRMSGQLRVRCLCVLGLLPLGVGEANRGPLAGH